MRKISFVLFAGVALVALIAFSMKDVDSCPPPLECRVTGGGVDVFSGEWNGTMAWGKFKKLNGGWDRYTFGGQAGAPTASQPQPYGEWTHHNQSGESGSFVFHAGTASAPEGTEINLIACSDPPGCSPSGDPPSPCKKIYFEGVGTFKNIKDSPLEFWIVPGETFHWFEVYIADLGEPGRNGRQNASGNCDEYGYAFESTADCSCGDFYGIRIYAGEDDTTEIIYEVYGYITGGNLQIHHPIQ
jgi:hypothetical protein